MTTEQRSKEQVTAHTPGPWVAEHDPDGCVIRPAGTGYLLARLDSATFTYGADLKDGPPHNLEANAHLIAAAPELYEASKAAQCSCSIAERESGHALECWFPALHAALAKAEGRS